MIDFRQCPERLWLEPHKPELRDDSGSELVFAITRKRYYHPDQHGSWSIKAVLPTVCTALANDTLDGVQDGQAAQGAFLEAMAPGNYSRAKDRDRAAAPRLLRARHPCDGSFVEIFQRR